MKITSRLLLGTLATAAALGGSAAGAHADDAATADMNSMLCPIASNGLIGTVINGLNPESLAQSCPASPKTAARS